MARSAAFFFSPVAPARTWLASRAARAIARMSKSLILQPF